MDFFHAEIITCPKCGKEIEIITDDDGRQISAEKCCQNQNQKVDILKLANEVLNKRGTK